MRDHIRTTYLLIPVPKYPYYRIGPTAWQDYYRQLKRTVDIASRIKADGHGVIIAVISGFKPPGKPSEIDLYTKALRELADHLVIRSYPETNDTVGQVEFGFALAHQIGAKPVFITTWMHYLRVRYLARGRSAYYSGAFGIPQAAFFLIDAFCLFFQPLGDVLGVSNTLRTVVIKERERGRIL